MAKSIPSLANPKLLRWARTTAGIELAAVAKRVGYTEERVKAWEAEGEERPSIAKLRVVAEMYKRPLAVFYLSEVPKDFTPLRDLRRLPHGVSRDFSPKLRYLIRRVRERQAWAITARREHGVKRLRFVGAASQKDDILELAASARKLLRVTMVQQRSWKDTDVALRQWILRCESLGVFVFQASEVDLREMRGFALPDPIAPTVFVNSHDPRPARIFTLMHEFVHLLLGSEGVSNLSISERSRSAEQRLEVFCNAVAGEILVPRSDLTGRLRTMDRADDLDSAIKTLASAYSVSREVIARRMADVTYITKECYREKREQYQSDFEERPRVKQGEFKIPRATMIVRDNGRAFTKLVLTSYNEGFILGRDVSNLLNTKLKHLDRIRDTVYPVGPRAGVAH